MNAREINQRYLQSMYDAIEHKEPVLYRIKNLWWSYFEESCDRDADWAIDRLDEFMSPSQDRLRKLAEQYADRKVVDNDPDKVRQRINQFLKSNTGKMFERFIGLSIAYYLLKQNSRYAVWPFRKDVKKVCDYLSIENFEISCQLGFQTYKTKIDSDLIIFKPEDPKAIFYLVSVKSTLKDRFHNVPFWNLLRLCALSGIHNISTENDRVLSQVRYVAVCTDLAKEQPDFANEPRNLLCLDAALLDGAYVSSSSAKGLGQDDIHFSAHRNSAFYPLSKFVKMLCE